MKRILIIDCGASHCVVRALSAFDNQLFTLKGFSPIRDSFDHFPSLPSLPEIDNVFFFGTAMKGAYIDETRKQLLNQYPNSKVQVSSDLHAAALATAGVNDAYIHIMGTGSAVCKWNGQEISFPKVNLGYIWEDFASGYDIGKTIIEYWNSNRLNDQDKSLLEDSEGSITSFLYKVYDQENPKSSLSKISLYLDRLNYETRKLIINECLDKYFSKNIDIFAESIEHHFVGSMAFLFRDEIRVKMKSRNLDVGEIQKDTSIGLLKYYKSQITNQHE